MNSVKQLLSQLKKIILKDYGKPCPDFNWFCATCSAWMAFGILESLLTDDWEHK